MNAEIARRDLVVCVSPFERPDPGIVVGAARAGALGVLDLGHDQDRSLEALAEVAREVERPFGVRVPASCPVRAGEMPWLVDTVLLDGLDPDSGRTVADWASDHRRVLVEVTTRSEGWEAVQSGAFGVVVRGSESGGRVDEETAYVLLMAMFDAGVGPIWVGGGIGVHTAAGVIAGGAAGVVLDSQLALTAESTVPRAVQAAIGTMDGSETVVVAGHRVLWRPGTLAARLVGPDGSPLSTSGSPAGDRTQIADLLGGEDLSTQLIPVGQDGAFASTFAERWRTVEGVVHGLRRQIALHLGSARSAQPLAAGSPLARAHGLEYPIAQGPMTRVSDRPAFAHAVASAGALPFLALALMSGDEVREVMTETAALLGDLPWGVGILGFVPADVRGDQLRVIEEVRPPVALIAGGRPSQARSLEEAGIATYLHVPSPGLLARFLKEGARKFVFEGRECGGHVGPRSSLALWESQVEVLLGSGVADEVSVLFAGGVHDGRSAAVVAATGASLVEAGGRIGVLMGTAYLFTAEAVDAGAVVPGFQEQALACSRTVLLETSPGHATRCADTEYVSAFQAEKTRLSVADAGPQATWEALEGMNLGRLRLASKGLAHGASGPVAVAAEVQQREGMYMLGQVAALRSSPTTVPELHQEVSAGSAGLLADLEPSLLAPAVASHPPAPAPSDVAIVGMACVFPDAPDAETFWSHVVGGVDAVTEVPPERWDAERYYDPEAVSRGAGRKTPSKWGGFLPPVAFDALSFGIPPASLASIEPVQLLSLKVAAEAMIDAGYGPGSLRELDRERVSVIFGAEAGTDLAGAYGFRALAGQFLGGLPGALDELLPELTEDSFPGLLTNVISGRIANRLDLGGVNYTVDAACASSLAAVDAAVKELRSGTSDMVLCGGADLHNGINDYLLFSAVHALSPSGRCASFDAAADGIALGEGVACVVLKRLEDARRDGTRIYAVIAGIGGSSDGRSLGLTAPRPEGQRRALERAYAQAGIGPDEVGLVEAHGTGTVVGDRTELTVLNAVFSEAGARPGSCGLGSVKSQIGHTKCAAGLASMIKVARAIYHGVLPPTIHVREPNAAYDRDHGPFALRETARPWVDVRRVAGISAFGFGGTNFHAVLRSEGDAGSERHRREATPAHGTRVWPHELFLMRGKSRSEAVTLLEEIAEGLARVPDVGGRTSVGSLHLAALAAAAAERSGPVQVAMVVDDLEDLARKMSTARSALAERGSEGMVGDGVYVAAATFDGESERPPPKVAFVFPGQGSQRPGMLADVFVAFRGLHGHLRQGAKWLETMYPPSAFGVETRRVQARAITDTVVAQPTLGLVGMAMADLLARFGVRPSMAGGHSYGELVALAVAGALPSDWLLAVSEARAQAILSSAGDDPGAMVAVAGSADEVSELLHKVPGVVLGNDNSPGQVVLSGPVADIEKASAHLAEMGLAGKRLPVACAFHSPVVAGASSRFGDYLEQVEVHPTSLPVWSNTTAGPYPEDPAAIRRLLSEQLARPVRFREQIESMYEAGARIFVEVGPGRVLAGLVDRILKDREHLAFGIEGAKASGLRGLLELLARLAVAGVPVNTAPLFEGRVSAADLTSVAADPPGWVVDGQLVRTATGVVVPGALQPAGVYKDAGAGHLTHRNGHDGDVVPGAQPEDVVVEYLRAMKEMAAEARQVVLAYLDQTGGTGTPSPTTRRASGRTDAGGHLAETDGAGSLEHPGSPSDRGGQGQRARPSLDGESLRRLVLDVVAERTGYPVDMLGPASDLEADLSIDSIKRLEIVGELVERVGLAAEDGGGAIDESVVEELVAVKTLDGIVAWLEAALASGVPQRDTGVVDDAIREPPPDHPRAPTDAPGNARRYLLRLEEVPMPDPSKGTDLEGMRVAIVAGEGSAVAGALCRTLNDRGGLARVVGAGTSIDDADTLVHLGALEATGAGGVIDFFQRVKEAVLTTVSTVLAVTATGGRSGFSPHTGTPQAIPAEQVGVAATLEGAGIRGVVRTLVREHPQIRARVVDLDPYASPDDIASMVTSELAAADELVEVGRAVDSRTTIAVVPAERAADSGGVEAGNGEDRPPVLSSDMVVLVTGGARGITAHVSEALLERFGCTVVLVGRTPAPEEAEPDETASASDAPSLRRRLVELGLDEPAKIEAQVARIMSEREVRGTLQRLERYGARVQYRSADVSDPVRVRELIDGVRREFGRLDGIVHGAGIVEDRLLVEKSAESFERVFSTKVTLPRVLAEDAFDGAGLDGVGFLVVFGSVSGVLGNRGQVDYAAANAAAAALARSRDRRVPGRTVVVDWGPWAGGGMVSPGLAHEFDRRGIGLLDPAEAVSLLFDELGSEQGEPEVVIMRATPEGFASNRS